MNHIEVGDRVEIESLFSGSASTKYTTTVLQIREDGLFILDEIKRNRVTVYLDEEKDYIFIFYCKSGIYKHDGRLNEYLTATYGGRVTNLPSITIFDEGIKLQRREFFRFNCELEVNYKVSDNFVAHTSHGLVIDLSAGGLKFIAKRQLEKNDILNLELALKNDFLLLTAEVMYIDKDGDEYQYRCRFLNLLDSDKDAIIQAVLDAQRDELKKKTFREKGGNI